MSSKPTLIRANAIVADARSSLLPTALNRQAALCGDTKTLKASQVFTFQTKPLLKKAIANSPGQARAVRHVKPAQPAAAAAKPISKAPVLQLNLALAKQINENAQAAPAFDNKQKRSPIRGAGILVIADNLGTARVDSDRSSTEEVSRLQPSSRTPDSDSRVVRAAARTMPSPRAPKPMTFILPLPEQHQPHSDDAPVLKRGPREE